MTQLEALAALIEAARRAGAEAADAMLTASETVDVTCRHGRIEQLERTESAEVGLRVFTGRASAIVSATGADRAAFPALAARAMAMARVVPEDPFAGLAEDWAPPGDAAGLDLADPETPALAVLEARAAAAEAAALAVPGITNTDGGSASFGRSTAALVTSAGFAGTTARTSHGLSVVAMAGSGTGMQRDYEYAAATYAADLPDAAALGQAAAERALKRLNPARPRTAQMPVVFDRRIAGGLLSHLLGAINGAAVARGTSFLKDRMDEAVFAPGIEIVDDPLRVERMTLAGA